MYDDYPTTTYNSNVNQLLGFEIAAMVVVALIVLITIISIMRVYKKANRSPITAWIPIYNIVVLLEICNLPLAYLFFFIIPGVNIYFLYKMYVTLAKVFNKEKKFGIGLLILPFIFFPVLAFSKNEYVGLDITGKESSMQMGIIHEIDDVKTKEIEVEVNDQEDTAFKNINISLGGGVYQKEYASNLSNVTDDEKLIKRKVEEQPVVVQQPEIIKPIVEEEKAVEEQPKQAEVFDINYIKNNNSVQVPTQEVKKEEIVVPLNTEEKKPEIIVPLDTPVSTTQVENTSPVNEESVMPNVNEKPELIPTEEKTSVEEVTQVPQTDANSEFIICPKCGNKLKNGTSTCFMCGNKII